MTGSAQAEAERGSLAGFYAGLLDRFTTIVGEGAGYATIHFAAVQEGLEHGRQLRQQDAKDTESVAQAAALLGHEAKHQQTDLSISVTITDCSLLGHGTRTLDGVVIGYYEGLWRGLTGAIYDGEITDRDGRGGRIVLTKKGSA